jgi:hypothetical protein
MHHLFFHNRSSSNSNPNIFRVGGGGRQFSITSTLVCSHFCKDENSLLPLQDPYSLFLLLGDCFIVVVVKILLAQVSTPHDAKLLLLLRREKFYYVKLGA